tara:strand:+ start:69399 stop:70043 length:645 start_codon:yes stop_codon:yes gene_type:complete
MTELPKIKICGITNLEDARFISGAMVDYLGFIFYEQSPRYIEPGMAGAITEWLEGPEKIGVFVNQSLDEVNRIAKETGLDYVQLHGNESPEYCALVDKPVIKVIHISDESTLDSIQEKVNMYADSCSYYLFDTKTDELWGGTGSSFDWGKLKSISNNKPFFLAGGLKTENIRKAIETVHPYAVDVSSSLEEKPGLKDFNKVEQFMEEMRSVWED